MEGQLVAPDAWSDAGVGADLEEVVDVGLQALDDRLPLRGVGGEVLHQLCASVIHDLVEHDLSVAMLLGWEVPL